MSPFTEETWLRSCGNIYSYKIVPKLCESWTVRRTLDIATWVLRCAM